MKKEEMMLKIVKLETDMQFWAERTTKLQEKVLTLYKRFNKLCSIIKPEDKQDRIKELFCELDLEEQRSLISEIEDYISIEERKHCDDSNSSPEEVEECDQK